MQLKPVVTATVTSVLLLQCLQVRCMVVEHREEVDKLHEYIQVSRDLLCPPLFKEL